MFKFLFAALLGLHCSFSLGQVDSLRLMTYGRDTTAVIAGYEMGKHFLNTDIDSSYFYFHSAAGLAKDLRFTRGQILTYRAVGATAPKVDKFDEAFARLDEGLKLIDSLDLGAGNKVDFLTNKGVIFYRQGLIGKAIENYIEAVEICKNNDLDVRRSRLLNNLGIFYRILKRYEEAIVIYRQSYSMRHNANDSLGMANILFNMGAAFAKLSKPDSTLKVLNAAEKLYTAIDSDIDVLTCKVAKGTAHIDLGQFNKANEQFQQAIMSPQLSELQNPFRINLYHGLANIFLKEKKLALAESYLLTIREDVNKEATAEEKATDLQLWSVLYREKRNYKSAYESLLAFKNLGDTLNNEQNAELRSEMETKYLTKEKEYQIELLNTENELSELKLTSLRQRNIGLGIGLLLFAFFLVWLFYLFRKAKRQNEIILKAHQEKEVLLKEIHHRVKNNLQVVSSLLTLQSKYIDDYKAIDAINTGKSRVQSMSILHRNLYQNENLKNIKIKPYFKDLLENLVSIYSLGNKDIMVDSDIDDIELDVDTVIPLGLVTNELISNALKYAFENKDSGQLHLSVKQEKDHLLLSVEDDGEGIPFTEVPRRSKTLGMQLIHSFTKKLKGNISIDNQDGTKFQIIIPLKTSSSGVITA